MVKVCILAFALVSTACGYNAGLRDCAISCSGGGGCPDGFTCREGLCRSEGATESCSAVADGGEDGSQDAAADAALAQDAPGSVVLSENDSADVTAAAFSCTTCPPNVVAPSVTHTLSWYREFSLPEFSGAPWNVTGGFQITTVHVGCREATGADIDVKVYGYTGTLHGTTIEASGLTPAPIGSATMHVQTCNSESITVPINAPIPMGTAFVVQVEERDVFSDNNGTCSFSKKFRLGANRSNDSYRSYYKATCATGSAVNTPTTWPGNAPVITVEGTAN